MHYETIHNLINKTIRKFITEDEIEAIKIDVFTVVDINHMNKDDYNRVYNTLIDMIDCKDSEMEKSTMKNFI